MKNPTALYKGGGSELVWGIPCETIVVDADEVEQKLSEGYVMHPHDIPVLDVTFPDGSVNDEPPSDLNAPVEEIKQEDSIVTKSDLTPVIEKPKRGRKPKVV